MRMRMSSENTDWVMERDRERIFTKKNPTTTQKQN